LNIRHFTGADKIEVFDNLRRPIGIDLQHIVLRQIDAWREKLTSAPGPGISPCSDQAWIDRPFLRDRAKSISGQQDKGSETYSRHNSSYAAIFSLSHSSISFTITSVLAALRTPDET
jgi:hypothetical protein